MVIKQKPKIGFLGIMHGLYDKRMAQVWRYSPPGHV